MAKSDQIRRIESAGSPRSKAVSMRFDSAVARSYGALAHTVATAGRKARTRVTDILIAGTAQAHGAALYTCDDEDFAVFGDLVELHVV